jgi:hypothetical protein
MYTSTEARLTNTAMISAVLMLDGVSDAPAAETRTTSCDTLRTMQRRALGLLFAGIAVSLGLIAAWSALEGGRAWVVALAAGALALWIGDLARRAWPW